MKYAPFPSKLFLALLALTPLVFMVGHFKNPFLLQGVLLQTGVALLVLAGLARLATRGLELRSTPLDRFWLGWVIAAVISLVNAALNDPFHIKAVIVNGADNLLFLVVNCTLVFYLATSFSRDNNFIKAAVNIILAVAGIASLYGLLQYFGIEPFWPQQVGYFQGRMISTFGNPAFLASFLVLAIPVGIARLLSAEGAGKRLLLLALILVTCTALIASSARSGWLGLIVALAVLLLYLFKTGSRRQARKILQIMAVVIAVAAVTVTFSGQKKLLGLRASLDPAGAGTSLHQRFLIWSCATEMFIRHPVVGQGWGLFELLYPGYQGKYLQNPTIAPFRTHANHAHNEVLNIAAELGLTGLLLGIYFLNIFFRRANSVLRSGIPEEDRILAIGLLAGVLGQIADSFFNVALHITAPAMFFWLAVGLLFSLSGEQPEETRLQAVGWKAAAILAMPVVLLLVAYNVTRLTAAVDYFDGNKLVNAAESLPPEKTAEKAAMLSAGVSKLERSCRWFPWNTETAYELGGGYYRQRRVPEAVAMYIEAADLNFGYDEIYYMLGMSEMELGRLTPAAEALGKAFDLNPNSPAIREGILQLQAASGQRKKPK
jgi:O-antigen ligase